ncbi:NAD-dependent protein deacetylase HST1-like protein [Melia azedarach]|uniref:NAD-dependent protein deacetylase HST1-like protein n=1 Tax=Melia azedarach TaxID=155640 RepID=A0ACC1Y6Z2_MELAZ|nr:NAD-dependent protein deacetylase HST1-like protein [Melia azedarach]
MKIFNWVHRKFNHNILKDGFARNVKKTESIAIDTNTKALLEQVALVDVLDGWRDGILTIGTFGFDPLKPVEEQKEFFIFESEDEEGENDSVNREDDDDDHEDDNIVEDEEVNPLIFTTFEHNFEEIAANGDGNVGKADVIITLDGVQITPFVGSPNELRFDIDTTDNDQGKKRRRTTLADLFYEDSDIKKKPIEDQEFEASCGKKQSSVRTKNSLSFAKKLIPHVKEDSRPIKKLHQMMRKMLKRKIHPELEGKVDNSDGENKACILELFSKKHQAGESASLLPIPDATAA